MSRLYQLYEDWCKENNLIAAKTHLYNALFKEQNIGFHRPRKDACAFCLKINEGLSDVTEEEKNKFAKHRNHIKQLNELKNKWEHLSSQDQFACIDYDLEAVLYTPKLSTKAIFYKRKLASCNFTIHNFSTNKGYAYFWPEYEGGRGAIDIATCLYLHIIQELPEKITHLAAFSDSCGGQNRNKFIATMLSKAVVDSKSLTIIDMFYFEPGHSSLRADSMHSAITTRSKFAVVYEPYQWVPLISTASTSAPYYVKKMDHESFIDWKQFAKDSNYSNWRKTTANSEINWMKVKWIRVLKDEPHTILVKDSACEEDPFEKLLLSVLFGKRDKTQCHIHLLL